MNKRKLTLLGIIALLVIVFFATGAQQHLSFSALKQHQQSLQQWVDSNYWLAAGAYFAGYTLVTGLSLPGAAVLSLAAGAFFGVLMGSLLVSFASSIGATLAFLLARYLFRESLSQRFSSTLSSVNTGIERDGLSYLATLRLVPLFPFFVINLVMGLTKMKTVSYYWVSQLCMLPATVIFVNAGTQLANLESPAGILSPAMIISLSLLGLFPWVAKVGVKKFKLHQARKGYQKPQSFDRNLIVIGAGAGGLVTSYIAAAVKAKVTLIEKNKMGGDCLNTGCVPSKALLRTTRFLADVRRSETLGIRKAEVEYDFPDVMQRVRKVISEVEPHDSVERYTKLGVECIQGTARIVSPWEVEVNGQTLTTRHIVIATGGRPRIPKVPGIEQVAPLTSDTIWDLQHLPRKLLIMGGGAIGCELGQAFARLGSDVTMVFRGPHILPREDEDASAVVEQRLRQEGLKICSLHTPDRFSVETDKTLICMHQGQEVRLDFDELLVATGRTANVKGFGLEELGIATDPDSTLEVDRYLRTLHPNILACGDVAGPFQFTHAAGHQAWYAAVNALFGDFKSFKADHRFIPFTTYTSPEVARIGINEKEAKQQDIRYEVTQYDISDLDRAITDDARCGFVKVLTKPGKDHILGVTIVGEHGSELLPEFAIAMKHGLGLNKILGTIHAYPTMNEANKYVAGQWRRAHSNEKLLTMLERFHRWRRGEERSD